MMHDSKSIAPWVSLVAVVVGAAISYGVLREKVLTLERDVAVEATAHTVFDRRLQENEKAVAVMSAAVVEIRDMLRADRARR